MPGALCTLNSFLELVVMVSVIINIMLFVNIAYCVIVNMNLMFSIVECSQPIHNSNIKLSKE